MFLQKDIHPSTIHRTIKYKSLCQTIIYQFLGRSVNFRISVCCYSDHNGLLALFSSSVSSPNQNFSKKGCRVHPCIRSMVTCGLATCGIHSAYIKVGLHEGCYTQKETLVQPHISNMVSPHYQRNIARFRICSHSQCRERSLARDSVACETLLTMRFP